MRISKKLLSFSCLVAAVAIIGSPAAFSEPAAPVALPATPTVPEIWFSPRQSADNPDGKGVVFNVYDFSAMLASNAQWQNAASHMSVMDLNMHTLESYPDMSSVLNLVNTSSFKIITGGAMFYTNGDCSVPPTEGISNDKDYEHETYAALRKWKLAGGRIDYIGMDEPLDFAYLDKKIQNLCHFSIETVAQRAATTVNMILLLFPDAQVVDYEGTGQLDMGTFLQAWGKFVTAFNATATRPISHIGMDMHWDDAFHTGYHWVPAVTQYANYAHSLGIKAGLFMDSEWKYVETGDGQSVENAAGVFVNYPETDGQAKALFPEPVTNASWMQMVRDHMQLAHDQNVPIDFVLVASWMPYPTVNLPETSPDAFTSLVDYAYDLWTPAAGNDLRDLEAAEAQLTASIADIAKARAANDYDMNGYGAKTQGLLGEAKSEVSLAIQYLQKNNQGQNEKLIFNPGRFCFADMRERSFGSHS